MNDPEKIEYSEKRLDELVEFLKRVDCEFSPSCTSERFTRFG